MLKRWKTFKYKIFSTRCFCFHTVQCKLEKRSGKHFKLLKVLVHFEINFWYVLAYLKGIQDVGVFVSTGVSILILHF